MVIILEEKKFNVLIADNIAKEGVDILRDNKNINVEINTDIGHEELLEKIGSFDAMIVRSRTKINRELVNKAKKLKVVTRAGTGYDNIDLDVCNEHGIVVLITPLGNANAVVELTLGLMIDASRHISNANLSMCKGKWEKKNLKGTELKNKTVGIIGLGRIGAGVAKRCKAFEMNVIAYDKFIPKDRADDLGVTLYNDLIDVLKLSDYVTIHLPLTPQTTDLIGETELREMKPNAVIINVARGGVVNEEALYKVLEENVIAGACIDVYSHEPADPKEYPFIGLSNCLTTPHLGANTVEAQINVAKLAAEHTIQALNSKIFIDAVNIPFKLTEDMADLYRPYMLLGSHLGKFLGQYNEERIQEVAIKYKSNLLKNNFEPIKAVILQTLFESRFMDTITYMNIDSILEENGIELEIGEYDKYINFENYIKVYIKTENTETKIAGTVFIERPKIVEINGLFFDFEPADYMLVIENIDKPGVIGNLGTFLGEKGINIAGMQLGRKEKGSEAIAVISIDDRPTPDDLNELKKLPNVLEIHLISL
ncbi:MAG: phosphoglycerate dehydrogenase [Candidatus Lokiarchaeota archaeon]|nr:phosphoglycerate dehydrogenase [Candidatus Lokiarchaeota archaeon]